MKREYQVEIANTISNSYDFDMQDLSFSLPELTVRHCENKQNIGLSEPTILFNAHSKPMNVGSEALGTRASSIFTNETIDHAENIILITAEAGFSALKQFPTRNDLMQKWQHVHDIFPLPHLKNTNLWRSPKETIGSISYNLWFAAEGTDCGIHNTHDFLEVHTQIWGTGHMQKFHKEDEETLYQDVYMTPGFTHEPFCDENNTYPWHRYFADTDCIWLAVEYN